MSKMAVMVDGAFFLKRFRKVYPRKDANNPEVVATTLFRMAVSHLKPNNSNSAKADLYRIFFYDCPPMTKRVHNPVSKRALNLATTPMAVFRNELHKELKRKRKVALRLGHLAEKNAGWELRPQTLERLIKSQITWDDLTDDNFRYSAKQTGVDMRIGVDITLLAQKKLVDKIVLVAGDSDFVPAAKQARREGIDFILDPMWNRIAEDLHEHIDGLRSVTRNPNIYAR